MGLLYERAGRLTAENGGFWPRQMHVVGTFYARGTETNSSDLAYNSVPFFDRGGKLLGAHNKNEMYDPEEDYGVSPGRDGFPVFETDGPSRPGVVKRY